MPQIRISRPQQRKSQKSQQEKHFPGQQQPPAPRQKSPHFPPMGCQGQPGQSRHGRQSQDNRHLGKRLPAQADSQPNQVRNQQQAQRPRQQQPPVGQRAEQQEGQWQGQQVNQLDRQQPGQNRDAISPTLPVKNFRPSAAALLLRPFRRRQHQPLPGISPAGQQQGQQFLNRQFCGVAEKHYPGMVIAHYIIVGIAQVQGQRRRRFRGQRRRARQSCPADGIIDQGQAG